MASRQCTDNISYLNILHFAKCGEISRLFHHTSVYCFTLCHLYTTEPLQWTMQFVLKCYFFEFECLFWMVCSVLSCRQNGPIGQYGASFQSKTSYVVCCVQLGGSDSQFLSPHEWPSFRRPPSPPPRAIKASSHIIMERSRFDTFGTRHRTDHSLLQSGSFCLADGVLVLLLCVGGVSSNLMSTTQTITPLVETSLWC